MSAVRWPLVGLLSTLSAAVFAQSDQAKLRTPWGHPDLQGVWDFRTVTPLERPDDLSDKEVLTDEEAAVFLRAAPERNRAFLGTFADPDMAHELWVDPDATGEALSNNRTALVVDPPDGKIPRTVETQGQLFELLKRIFSKRPDSSEDRALSERCIEWIDDSRRPCHLPGWASPSSTSRKLRRYL